MAATKIAVTGASGFIGSRVVEVLLDGGYDVVPVTRNHGRAAKLSTLPIRPVVADILDSKAILNAFSGVDVVVHCAYGNTPDISLNERITSEGTAIVVQAAMDSGVRRIVHLSTVSVYGSDLPNSVNESTPYGAAFDWYSRAKQKAESIVLNAQSPNFEVVVLQPAIVYGPWAGVWTVDPVRKIQSNRLVLYDAGRGYCNTLYVDNLAAAVSRACVHPRISGERLLLTDGLTETTWAQFFGKYATMLGKDLTSLSKSDVSKRVGRQSLLSPLVSTARVSGKAVAAILKSAGLGALAESGRVQFRQKVDDLAVGSHSEYGFYSSRTIFDSRRAQQVLDWCPKIGLDEGMERTEAWLRFVRLI